VAGRSKANDVPVAGEALLRALSAGVVETLQTIPVPAYIVDRQRRVRWQNAASIDLFGDVRGRLDASVGLDPEDLRRVRDAWACKLDGAPYTQLEVSLSRPDGTRIRVAVNSVPLRDPNGVMIGSFGLAYVLEELGSPSETAPRLSRREHETLKFLAAGLSTAQMAQQMGISKETVRNHVKGLLRNLDARSRVEAVAKARGAGLI
jgi:DNA-binding CsgD family transcriptional regulator